MTIAMRKFFVASLLWALALMQSQAEIRLPEIIGDNMVLQQQTSVNIWGTATPGSTILAVPQWNGKAYTCPADADGHWIISIDTPAAGLEPQTLEISEIRDGKKATSKNIISSIRLENILIGEVWLCSGQSNMEMPLAGFWDCPVEDSAGEIALSGRMTGIRMATIPKTGALVPQNEVDGAWKTCSPENTALFSAAGYHFGRMLHEVLEIPVGIINCSWGGSTLEGWLPYGVAAGYDDIECIAEAPEDGRWNAHTPCAMYNGMLYPLRNYTVKGFCWYQGESNVGRHDTYAERLQTMVSIWRELWGQGELPFYIVEIAPYLYGGDGTSGARLREAQFKAAREIPSSGIICTNDLVYPYEDVQIHPCRKKEVGQRLAYLALNRTYGYAGIECEGPVYREMKPEGDEILLFFDNDASGFSPWHDITGFEIAGEDRIFHPAEARVIPGKKCVAVKSSEVQSPVAVRYCFRDFCPGNLTGARNLPVYPFRTDNW